MDKKGKDCSYWIAVLVTGLALGAIAGFVFGWLWKEGPTSSEATKLVDVFIAIGTVGSVVFSSFFTVVSMSRKRNKDELVARFAALQLEPSIIALKTYIEADLAKIKGNDLVTTAENIKQKLSMYIRLLDLEAAQKIAKVNESIGGFVFEAVAELKILSHIYENLSEKDCLDDVLAYTKTRLLFIVGRLENVSAYCYEQPLYKSYIQG